MGGSAPRRHQDYLWPVRSPAPHTSHCSSQEPREAAAAMQGRSIPTSQRVLYTGQANPAARTHLWLLLSTLTIPVGQPRHKHPELHPSVQNPHLTCD